MDYLYGVAFAQCDVIGSSHGKVGDQRVRWRVASGRVKRLGGL